jgi:hypothetical protein
MSAQTPTKTSNEDEEGIMNHLICMYLTKNGNIASVSLSSLSLSSEKKKKNKAKTPKPTSGPFIKSGKLYFHTFEELPAIEGGEVHDAKYFLVGAYGVKEIYFANMDEKVKGKGPGTASATKKEQRWYIDDDVNESSVIVLGRKVTYDELLAALVDTPKSPAAPVNEDDFGIEGEGEEEVGKA